MNQFGVVASALGNHDYYGGSVRGVRDAVASLRHPLLHPLPVARGHRLQLAERLLQAGQGGRHRLGEGDGRGGIQCGTDRLRHGHRLGHGGVDGHGAPVAGEALDGVAHQIVEDAPQADRVGQDRRQT